MAFAKLKNGVELYNELNQKNLSENKIQLIDETEAIKQITNVAIEMVEQLKKMCDFFTPRMNEVVFVQRYIQNTNEFLYFALQSDIFQRHIHVPLIAKKYFIHADPCGKDGYMLTIGFVMHKTSTAYFNVRFREAFKYLVWYSIQRLEKKSNASHIIGNLPESNSIEHNIYQFEKAPLASLKLGHYTLNQSDVFSRMVDKCNEYGYILNWEVRDSITSIYIKPDPSREQLPSSIDMFNNMPVFLYKNFELILNEHLRDYAEHHNNLTVSESDDGIDDAHDKPFEFTTQRAIEVTPQQPQRHTTPPPISKPKPKLSIVPTLDELRQELAQRQGLIKKSK